MATADVEQAIDWAWLSAQRERWLKERFGGGHWPARLAAGAQANFAAFAASVAAWAPAEAPSTSAVALAFFGPPGCPPPALWDAYIKIHRRLTAAAPDPERLNPFDLALSFGCGWGRNVVGPLGQWPGRWEVAYATIINQVGASLAATNRLLIEQFPQFALTDDDLLELPGDFTVSVLGACDCEHHRRGCGHRCGRRCCFPRHDLGEWDPLVCHLRPFLDQAVRGTAAKQILGAAFAESLTYSALEREGRILRRRVEFRRCPGCQSLYDEAACPTPGCEPPNDSAVSRVARANWLIRPEHEGGNYREMVRWVCGGCGGIYPIRYKLQDVLPPGPCPVCKWSPSETARPATVTVWARVFEGEANAGRRAVRDVVAGPEPYGLVAGEEH